MKTSTRDEENKHPGPSEAMRPFVHNHTLRDGEQHQISSCSWLMHPFTKKLVPKDSPGGCEILSTWEKRKETHEYTKAIYLQQLIDPEQCEKVTKKASKDAGLEFASSEVVQQGCNPTLVSLYLKADSSQTVEIIV